MKSLRAGKDDEWSKVRTPACDSSHAPPACITEQVTASFMQC